MLSIKFNARIKVRKFKSLGTKSFRSYTFPLGDVFEAKILPAFGRYGIFVSWTLQLHCNVRLLSWYAVCLAVFSDHMFAATKKANGIMGVIRRTFTHLDLKCFSLLYKSLIRPHLEYGVFVWFPYRMKDIEAIERVQKRATQQIKQIRHLATILRINVSRN